MTVFIVSRLTRKYSLIVVLHTNCYGLAANLPPLLPIPEV